ncbi:hypothetical protein VNO77_02329 [Canavalia gladiata]|uniref:Secreted protein n=1 Tax=Canavalia gladiata TaxID=3824 RepID=A0AAN9MXR3_CANGL
MNQTAPLMLVSLIAAIQGGPLKWMEKLQLARNQNSKLGYVTITLKTTEIGMLLVTPFHPSEQCGLASMATVDGQERN